MSKQFILRRFCLGIILASGLAMGCANSVNATDTEESMERPGYTLVAHDEFNESTLDEDLWFKWYMPHWTTRDVCEANYDLVDGMIELKITPEMKPWDPGHDGETVISSIQTAEKDELHRWTSYGPITHHEPTVNNHLQKYGYYEIRAKIAKGGGLHSAWWMIGFQQDDEHWGNSMQTVEVDIFEALGRNNATNLKYNLIRWNDSSIIQSNLLQENNVGFDMSEEFHVYGFEWDETSMKLYVDGNLVKMYNQSVQYPMLTLLGLYEKRHATGWTGPFDSSVPYPKKFTIDYWRAYQRDDMIHRQNEAEFAKLNGSATSDYRIGASNFRVVGWIGNGSDNYLEFTNVYVNKNGLYDLNIHYMSWGNRNLSVKVNNQSPIHLTNLNSGGWNSLGIKKIQVQLEEGENTIRLYNNNGYAPDIDRIIIDDASNLAPKAHVSATSYTSLQPLRQIKDSNMSYSYQSNDIYHLPEYITFTWAQPQNLSKVKISNFYSKNQAIVNFDIEVSADGQTNWVKVASSGDIQWKYDNGSLESKEVSFNQVMGKKGVRIKVNKVNSYWNHFTVNEVEIY